MAKPKVIVTRRWPAAVESRIQDVFDARLNESDAPMTENELQEAMVSADALMPTVTDKISTAVIGTQGRRAKIIGNFGVGFNNIDIEAAKQQAIIVTNTPEVLTDCTADIAMLLLLAVARRGGEGERHLRQGEWSGWRPTHMMGTKVTGKTLGIIGMGRIARAVAHKAHHGFGMRIMYHDPYLNDAALAEVKAVGGEQRSSVEAVLQEADFVSLHCPSTPQTRHLMNSERFAAMKPGAFLINTARGDVVNEAALIEALRTKVIAGAGLDVYEEEPRVSAPLLEMENVVLLPHLGSATEETRAAMGFRVVDNVQAFFDGKEPPDRVA